ncbi:MAG: PAS domain S-box protein [Bacteroidales bacterium]|nr:PAS domain S-box protein [Bacteroidales bacterium]
MEANNRKDFVWQYTALAAIFAAVFALTCVVIGLATDKVAAYSVKGVFVLFRKTPVYWLILLITMLVPVITYFLSRYYARQMSELQQVHDEDQERLGLISKYSQQLIAENYEVDFPLSGDNDQLGKSLLELRDALKVTRDNNLKIRKEEEQRSWIAESLAHFSEILRNNLHDPQLLSFSVIKDLTKYINAVQGGFYLLDDTDPYNKVFNLTAFFAYDRRKFTDQQIKWGDGLIGTCALEQKIIHLKQIPESYITVTSGLGEANPNNLLIIPMQYENQIYGVLEFASFNKFESGHIALAEKTAESVASTLSAVRTNLKTAQLLEESKAQTQALTSHEEEMRQNMEELQATQEEATRQSQRFLILEESINQNLIRAEFDTDGRLISANGLFFEKFEFSSDMNIVGKPISELVSAENRDWLKGVWNKLIHDHEPFRGYIKHVTRTGKNLWTIATLSAAKKEDGSVEKFILLSVDTSAERIQIEKNELIVGSFTNTCIKAELDINGNLQDCNENFIKLFKLSQKEIKSLVIFDIIHPIELEAFNKKWDAIIKGIGMPALLRGKTTQGEEIWLNGSFDVVHNMAHEIQSVVFVGHDITHEKELETEVKIQSETLKKQEKLIKEAEKELTTKLRETRNELLGQFRETERIKNFNEKTLEDSPDAIVTTSHDNRIVFFNKAAEQLWKTDRKEVLNEDVSVLFPEHLTDKDELLASFIRPGDHKITGQRKNSTIIDKTGKEKKVKVLLTKARVDNENAFTAFIQID